MRCILSPYTDANFNLASEEYLLKNSPEEYFLLYFNSSCVVIGKHQNLVSEINIPFIIENKISVARRITGGGTVYHDSNNINFSFIKNISTQEKLNYSDIIQLMISALNQLNLNVISSSRHDIILDNKKISGSAMHVFKNRYLVHGTLLYNSNLITLSKALKNNKSLYSDKSVKSVPATVTNIYDYINTKISLLQFTNTIFNHILNNSFNSYIDTLSQFEYEQINELIKIKYITWEWIYGYSPSYKLTKNIIINSFEYQINIDVCHGFIKSVTFDLNAKKISLFTLLFQKLINLRHEYNCIYNSLKNDPTIINYKIDVKKFCFDLF